MREDMAQVRSNVAEIFGICQSCTADELCPECEEDVRLLQRVTDYDVTEYIPADVEVETG